MDLLALQEFVDRLGVELPRFDGHLMIASVDAGRMSV